MNFGRQTKLLGKIGRSIKVFLFDLDGTLYNQKKMHVYMLTKLLLYYGIRPHRLYELRVIYYFRKKRYDAHGKENVEHAQYQITAEYLHMPVEEVRKIISFMYI
jgi:phosphoglycolate phosphatase/putative hydrolase of the HAD superfamily